MKSRLVPIVLGQVISLLVGVLGTIMMSHWMPEATYGEYGKFLALSFVGFYLTHSGLSNHTSRSWMREEPRRHQYVWFLLGKYRRELLPLTALILAVTAGSVLMGEGAAWLWAFPLLMLTNSALALVGIAVSVGTAESRPWSVFWVWTISSATRSILPPLFFFAAGRELVAAMSGLAFASILSFAVVASIYWKLGRASRRPDEAAARQWNAEYASYALPYALIGLSGWGLQYADRWVVDYFFGEDVLGLFSLAANLGTILPGMISTALLQLAVPVVFKRADQAGQKDWRRLSGLCDKAAAIFALVSFVSLVALQWISPLFVGTIIGEDYAPALKFIIPAGLACATLFINQFNYLLLQGQDNIRGIVQIMSVALAIKVTGAIAASAISFDAYLVWCWISILACGLAGRSMARRIAFRQDSQPSAS